MKTTPGLGKLPSLQFCAEGNEHLKSLKAAETHSIGKAKPKAHTWLLSWTWPSAFPPSPRNFIALNMVGEAHTMTAIPAGNLLISWVGLLAGPAVNHARANKSWWTRITHNSSTDTRCSKCHLGTQPVRAQVAAQQNPSGNTAQSDASDQYFTQKKNTIP